MVDAIFASDIHLGEKQPLCRTDDFTEASRKKLQWIADKAMKHKCPLILGGDIFDKPRVALEDIGYAIRALYGIDVYVVAGQHDLPGHSINNVHNSALGVLIAAGAVTLLEPQKTLILPCGDSLTGASWGQPLPTKGDIVVLHRFVYSGASPWPGCPEEAKVENLAKELRFAKCVHTGDNHVPFIEEYGDTVIVNPGSMMRRRADQMEHKPRIYLYNSKNNTVTRKIIPHAKGVVTRDHIESKSEVNERIQLFIKSVDKDYEVGLSFEDNMARFLTNNPSIPKGVVNMVHRAMEA